MQNNFENPTAFESSNSRLETGFSNLQSFRMPESIPNLPGFSAKAAETMLSFDGSSQFLLFDGEKQTAAAERQNNELQEKRGDKGENAEENDEEERERGKEDVRWVKELHGANENNAESKDLKESLGRIKPGELTPILDQLKNMKHDDAMQILRNNFERLAGADSGISPQELANELEVNKDPKVRAACIYATRYFDQFAKAGNLLGADWTGPVIEIIDLDNAKKPGL